MLGVALQTREGCSARNPAWPDLSWRKMSVLAVTRNPRVRRASWNIRTTWLWATSTIFALPPPSAMSSTTQKHAGSGNFSSCAGSVRCLYTLSENKYLSVFAGDISDTFHNGVDSTMDRPEPGELAGAFQRDRPSPCHWETHPVLAPFHLFPKPAMF